MKTKKSIYSALILIMFALLNLGCGALREATTPLIVPDFGFSPPSPVSPGSAGINIAMIEPAYSGNFIYARKSPFRQFRDNMGKDFEQILTAHGYILKGPYDSYDLMTYSDKNECELGLDIELNVDILQTSGGWNHVPPVSYGIYGTGGNYSEYKGTLNLSGKINISVIETFTRQKLLVKSVPIPQEDITVNAEAQFNFNATGIPLEDPGVHNPIANSLSNFYKSIMKLGWDLLSKEELEHLQKQVPEIREKAGFIKK